MTDQSSEKAALRRCRLFGHLPRRDASSWGVWHGRFYCARCLTDLTSGGSAATGTADLPRVDGQSRRQAATAPPEVCLPPGEAN